MVEHTDNQKQRGNAENKTAFYYIRYRQANVPRSLALSSSLEMILAPKPPVGRVFQNFCMTDGDDDDDRRQTDKTDCLTRWRIRARGKNWRSYNK